MEEKIVKIELSMNKKMGKDFIKALEQSIGYFHDLQVDWDEFGYGEDINPIDFYLEEIKEAIKEAFGEE